MYAGWISERCDIEDNCGVPSVLNNFPTLVGQNVTQEIIRSLVQSEKSDFFKCAKDLDWTMDVICYGLSMPMPDNKVEMVKNCVHLYLTWSSVMSTTPKGGIPPQMIENKEFYFSKILRHFTNLFIPRESASTDLQVKFCTQVLAHINGIVTEGSFKKEIAEDILRFYLGISGHLLSVAPMTGGLADQLCEKLINCLIQVWLQITCDFFPSPTLWRTLSEMFLSWRHHSVLVTQWNQLMHLLTCKVLDILFGPDYSQIFGQKNHYDEKITLPLNLTDEITVQCWIRFLHIIGNPVALTKIDEITSDKFLKHNVNFAVMSSGTLDAHPCLRSLPGSFLEAMIGVSSLVDMFLGVSVKNNKRTCSTSSQPFNRRDWRSSSAGAMQKKFNTDGQEKSPLPGGRKMSSEHLKRTWDDNYLQQKKQSSIIDAASADANCILHIFGAWLFDICLSGVNIDKVLLSVGRISCGMQLKKTNEDKEKFGSFPPVQRNEFEPGRAQAFITLCNIFCHPLIKGQSILPVYLSRFYLSIAVGLCYGETGAWEVLGSILMKATNIFCLDLQGVQVLVPHFLQALEIVLPVAEGDLPPFDDKDKTRQDKLVKLRRSCIQILLSIICLPLHFLLLPIQGLCREKVINNYEGNNNGCLPQLTFNILRKRITKLVMDAIKAETNPLNIQMLLGGMMLLIEDNKCAEWRSKEFGVADPCLNQVTPIDEVNSAKICSPKLVHLAKISTAMKPVESPNMEEKSQVKENPNDKSLIGSLGNRDDILTTQGEFVYLTNLIQQNMMFTSKWKGDLCLALCSLECLSGLANLHSKFIDASAARKTVKWICDYIECQANQPPQSQTKDLHSLIVAAFTCISAWIVNHPWLVENLQCLQVVLEVIELGISGCKSKSSNNEGPAKLKSEKELKSLSSRVRASAQALLAVMMEHLGYFPTPSGPASICSMLDEDDLLSRDNGEKQFTYFAIDGSILIGLKEDKVPELPHRFPSVISLTRGPTGKRVCMMQMKHFSRTNQHFSTRYKIEPERPAPLKEVPKNPKISQKHFPEEAKRVERSNCNDSIPDLKSILGEKQQEAQNHMASLMHAQTMQEQAQRSDRNANFDGLAWKGEDSAEEQPLPMGNYNAQRLFFSHMGLLRLENLEISPTQQKPAGLQFLDNTNGVLETALKNLDSMSTRTYDTVYVFFVKKGQFEASEIVRNKVPTLDNHLFLEFLYSLGWPVDFDSHTGWNGDTNTSWKINRSPSSKTSAQKLFYYSDLLTEIAIHVPAINIINTSEEQTNTNSMNEEDSIEIDGNNDQVKEPGAEMPLINSKHMSEHLSSEQKHRLHHTSSSETKFVIAWLQDINDVEEFPGLDLVELCDPEKHSYSSGDRVDCRVPEKEVIVIYIHPLKSGLFHVKLHSVFKSNIAGPLVNDMVVSRRVVGTFVRNTVINSSRRRRLEIQSYSHPHECRKLKIQDIVVQHGQKLDIPNLYSSLFDT